ncbi:MAG: RES domain-containing protein [Woeseiaceae bacterium]|nr:RES domain-containing protein [Woeseiaceae bacterium]
MAVRQLSDQLVVWRIGDPDGRFPIYSEEGARRNEGRWHAKGQDVIYTSEHYGTAMLEKLVHYNGVLPPNQHFIEIQIPAGVSYEVVTKDSISGWDRPDGTESREFGRKWLDDARSAILFVPSAVSREECNVLINPNHADSSRIQVGQEKPIRWDARLFD